MRGGNKKGWYLGIGCRRGMQGSEGEEQRKGETERGWEKGEKWADGGRVGGMDGVWDVGMVGGR